MKAWVLEDIGNIVYKEVAEPALSENEVLVEVKAAGICGSDIPRIYENGAHKMPLIPGHEFSGKVVKLGAKVNEKWLGKRVGIFPLLPCKECRPCIEEKYEMCRQYSYLGSRRDGGFAEYVAVPEWNLMELPENVSFEEAAMLEPMAVAVHALRRVRLEEHSTVVVTGLGTIGQLLVMFLLQRGIKNILVIGKKEFQKQTSLKLGIPKEHYCDSRNERVNDFILSHTNGYGADVFFECVGKNETISQAIDLTAPSGEVCLVGNPYTDVLLEKGVYWKILRHQLKVTGTWNSSYKGIVLNKVDVLNKENVLNKEDIINKKNAINKENVIKDDMPDDWKYVLNLLEQEAIRPQTLITHRFTMEDLEQGFHIMRDKSEDYIKVMMVR